MVVLVVPVAVAVAVVVVAAAAAAAAAGATVTVLVETAATPSLLKKNSTDLLELVMAVPLVRGVKKRNWI